MTRERGTGGISELKDRGLFVGRISLGYVDGKRQVKALYGKTKPEVRQKIEEFLENQNRPTPAISDETTGAFLGDWLERTVRLGTENATYEWYKANLRLYVLPHLGKIQLKDLSGDDIKGMLLGIWGNRPENLAKMRKAWVTIRAAINFALDEGKLQQDPLKSVKKMMRSNKKLQKLKKVMKTWDDTQARTFTEKASGDPLFAAYMLSLGGSMRAGEVLGLQAESIRWEENVVTVQHSQPEFGGILGPLKGTKTNSIRNVDLDPVTMEALKKHWIASGSPTTGYVFLNSNGRPHARSNLTRCFRRASRLAGVPRIRLHDLRHTSASLLLLAGTHVKVVQERLGHSTSKLTLDTYSHLMPTMQASAAAKLGDIFRKAA